MRRPVGRACRRLTRGRSAFCVVVDDACSGGGRRERYLRVGIDSRACVHQPNCFSLLNLIRSIVRGCALDRSRPPTPRCLAIRASRAGRTRAAGAGRPRPRPGRPGSSRVLESGPVELEDRRRGSERPRRTGWGCWREARDERGCGRGARSGVDKMKCEGSDISRNFSQESGGD